jgi:hypothetical protein
MLLHHSPCSFFNIAALLSAFNWQNVKFVCGFCLPRSSSAAAAQALAILVQAALVAASFAAPAHLAETAHSVTDPSSQKSLDLPFQVLPVQVQPVHLGPEVKPTAD